MTSDKRLVSERFPRSSRYHPEWLIASASGRANSLWLTEWLTTALDLQPGMRVLNLGCGRASSSIFLRREYGVLVWATDLWFSASENIQRIRDAGVEDGVFPIHADARSLPFAAEFFDALVCIDSFVYYGTDDLYLNYLAQFVKPDGLVGIAGAGLIREIEGPLPKHLREWWTHDLWCLHSATWWRRHWERTGIMDIEVADAMPDGWQRWLDWHRVVAPDNEVEIKALEADRGNYLGYVRLVGRRQGQAKLSDPIVSLPAQYTKKALLRSKENCLADNAEPNASSPNQIAGADAGSARGLPESRGSSRILLEPDKFQITSSKVATSRAELGFGAWDFFGVWISVFGIWHFIPSSIVHQKSLI